MIKFCPNCTAELKEDPKLAQGCKRCTNCGAVYFQLETTDPVVDIRTMKDEAQEVVDKILEYVELSKQIPEHLKKAEAELFFRMDKQTQPLAKAVAFKRWKDFIIHNTKK